MVGVLLSWRKLVSVSSNAQAASNVTEDNSIIAIAGELAATKYGLEILNRNIEDYSVIQQDL